MPEAPLPVPPSSVRRPSGLSPATRLLLALSIMTSASQFHRAALGVVGPELARDLGSGTGMLGAANGAFFLAIGLAQIPVGLALDRIGPRLTVALLTGPAVLGALAQALAPEAGWFLAARFLLGLGCGASFMASVVLCARWHAGEGLTTALARVFALSQCGVLLAGAPFAAASGLLGWRGAYALGAGLTVLGGVLWWRLVRDDPPGVVPPRRTETLAEALRGQFHVWRTPGLLPILCMHLVGYAVMATVLAVWAGPYLAEVHGLAPEPRGAVLLLMGLAVPAGLLGIGPVERRFGRPRLLVAGLAAGVVLVLAALAVWPSAPLPAAAGLLVLLCLLSCFPVLVVTQGRALFPDHLVGRGATTVNLAQTVGCAALPALTGAVVALAPAGDAWPVAFATLAAAMALGLAGYLAGGTLLPERPGGDGKR
jgi:predicted MFS family arabinose efflux permease